MKGRILFTALIIIAVAGALHSQSDNQPQTRKYNQNYNPAQVAKRLSWQNFKHIKLLQTSIINFGGGDPEVEKLIDQYAEASALYFQGRVDESASLFSENERELLAVAKKLSKKYKEDAEQHLVQGIRMSVKKSIKEQKKSGQKDLVIESCIDKAKSAVLLGNDLYDRYKDATTASPSELIKAIDKYRRAKEYMFIVYGEVETSKENREKFFTQYKKDIEDNKNKVYKSKEKIN